MERAVRLSDWEKILDLAGFKQDAWDACGTLYVPDAVFRGLAELVPWGSPGAPAGLLDREGQYVLFSRGTIVRPLSAESRHQVVLDVRELDRLVRNHGLLEGSGYEALCAAE